MKTIAVCILVFGVCIYLINAQTTLQGLQDHLDKVTKKFEQTAKSNPTTALVNALDDLHKAMMISDELVKAGLITRVKAVGQMITAMKQGLKKRLDIAAIKQWTQGVCTAKAWPFPQASVDMYSRYTTKLDMRLKGMCGDLELTYGTSN